MLRAVAVADPDLGLRLEARGATIPRGRQSLSLGDGTLLSATAEAPRRHGPDPSLIAFATLTFVAVSTTLFVVWAVRGVVAPLGRVAEAVDAFARDAASLRKPLALSRTGRPRSPSWRAASTACRRASPA